MSDPPTGCRYARLSWLPRFSIRGLFQLTFVAAIFFASYRAWMGSFPPQPGSAMFPFSFALYAAVATCLVLGLLQQARDIWRALHESGEQAAKLRAAAWWHIVWRSLLAILIGFLFSIRYLRREEWGGLDFLSEESHYDQSDGMVVNWKQPLSDSLLLLSLVITSFPGALAKPNSPVRKRLAEAGKVLVLVLATVWVGYLLAWVVLSPVFTHLGIRQIDAGEPAFFHGHRINPDRPADAFTPLFLGMAISSAAGCVGVAALRWLSKVWDGGAGRRVAPLILFASATVLQIYLVARAFGTGMPQASEHLWSSRPPVVSLVNFLGAALLLLGAGALVQRWRNADERSSGTGTLPWRKSNHFYPHEWAIVPLVTFWTCSFTLSTIRQLGEGEIFTSFRQIAQTLAYLLVEPGTLVHIAVVLTAIVRLYRWLRGDDLTQGGEIRAGSTAPVLTTAAGLLVTGLLAIPALSLTAFASWLMMGDEARKDLLRSIFL